MNNYHLKIGYYYSSSKFFNLTYLTCIGYFNCVLYVRHSKQTKIQKKIKKLLIVHVLTLVNRCFDYANTVTHYLLLYNLWIL